MLHQHERCIRELNDATLRKDAATADDISARLRWITQKRQHLDDYGMMITDRPHWDEELGLRREYGRQPFGRLSNST